MAIKIFNFHNNIKRFVQSNTLNIQTKYNAAKESISTKLVIPEKYKGTIVEKWAKYWNQLMIDYKDVFVDLGKGMINKPMKSTAYLGIGSTIVYLTKTNPEEIDFIEQLRAHNTEMLLVHESCHNSISSKYLTFVEQCYNVGIVRHLNLGILSVLWLDNYDKGVAMYKAMCPFLKPDYLTFHQRVIDIGFLNNWWNLKNKMIDYDVNDNELD